MSKFLCKSRYSVVSFFLVCITSGTSLDRITNMLCLPVLATQSYGEGEYLVTAWTNKPTNSRTILEARGCPIEIQQGICVPNQPTTTVDCKIVIACDSFFSRQHRKTMIFTILNLVRNMPNPFIFVTVTAPKHAAARAASLCRDYLWTGSDGAG